MSVTVILDFTVDCQWRQAARYNAETEVAEASDDVLTFPGHGG